MRAVQGGREEGARAVASTSTSFGTSLDAAVATHGPSPCPAEEGLLGRDEPKLGIGFPVSRGDLQKLSRLRPKSLFFLPDFPDFESCTG
jgi:hypothetical protein